MAKSKLPAEPTTPLELLPNTATVINITGDSSTSTSTGNPVEAAKTLVDFARKSGSNILMWVVLAMSAASPVVLQQISTTRGPGSATYLNQADFHILGPDRAEVGTLVRLTVADYEPSDVCWFKVGDSEKYGDKNGNLIFSVTEIGITTVTAAIVRQGELYLTQKDIEIFVAEKPPEPAVEPEVVPEAVEPEVVPEPVEPQPEPLTAIGRDIVKLCEEAAIAGDIAGDIADNLREAMMSAANPRALVMKTVELNKGLNLDDSVSEGIQILLQTLAENGELPDILTHVSVWRQMAEGFDAYARDN